MDRFWNKVDKSGPVVRPELGNCWIWTASKRNGYGAYQPELGVRKIVQAHRYLYEIEYGELPRLLRHKRDNRACVRPDHLEPGNHKDNAQDMLERNTKFTSLEEVVVQARRLAAQGLSIHQIQEQTGGKKPWLINVIQGRAFSHVAEPPVQLEDIYRPIYSKLSDKAYEEILEALSRPYHGQGRELAKKYNVDPSLITLIKKKRLKTIRGASQE